MAIRLCSPETDLEATLKIDPKADSFSDPKTMQEFVNYTNCLRLVKILQDRLLLDAHKSKLVAKK